MRLGIGEAVAGVTGVDVDRAMNLLMLLDADVAFSGDTVLQGHTGVGLGDHGHLGESRRRYRQ